MFKTKLIIMDKRKYLLSKLEVTQSIIDDLLNNFGVLTRETQFKVLKIALKDFNLLYREVEYKNIEDYLDKEYKLKIQQFDLITNYHIDYTDCRTELDSINQVIYHHTTNESIKTLSEWFKSGKNLGAYLGESCEVDKELYFDQKKFIKPEYQDDNIFQVGEIYQLDFIGKSLFATFEYKPQEDKYYYLGLKRSLHHG